MRTKNIIWAIVLAIFFSGCVKVTEQLPALTTYTIKLEKKDKENKNLPFSLEIKEPKALSSINSKYISYFQNGNISESYALSKWSDKPSELLQKAIVNYLSNTNNYSYINSSKINIRSDFNLVSELDSFNQIIDKKNSFAVLKIKVYLKKDGEVHFKNFSYKKECEENNAKNTVKNLNILTNKFVEDLNNWLLLILK